MVLLHFGNMKKDVAIYNTKLFAEKVAPQLRGIFEDKWERQAAAELMQMLARRLPRQVEGGAP